MKSIEIWNKGEEKLYAYIASFYTFMPCKSKIISILSLMLTLLFLPVDNSYAQYNIEITPVSYTWTYDGEVHQGNHCKVIVDNIEHDVELDIDDNQMTGTLELKRYDHERRLFRDYYHSDILTIIIKTSITDVGQKNVEIDYSIGNGWYEYYCFLICIFGSSSGVDDITSKSNVIVNNDATYTVTPRPLTINCIDAKEWDGDVSSCSRLISGFLSTEGSLGNKTYQYNGLVSGHTVTSGAFSTNSCDYGIYKYEEGTSFILTPFVIKQGNRDVTRNYTIEYKSQQKIVMQDRLISCVVDIDHVKCHGGNDGKIILSIKNYKTEENGDNIKYRYRYKINNESWQNASEEIELTNLQRGDYSISIKQEKSTYTKRYGWSDWSDNKVGNILQRDDYSLELIEPSDVNFNTNVSNALCYGKNGIINLSSTGGTSPYTYSIDGTNFGATNSYEKPVGTYTVYVKDANNCQKQQQVTISQPAELSVSTTPLAEYCKGISANLSASAIGGTTDYTYAWSPTDYLSATDAASVSVAPEKDMTYTVTVTDANGCTAQTSAEVKVAPLPAIVCKDYMILSSTGAVNVPLPEETSGKECSWSVDNDFSTNQSHITGTVTPGTSKTVKISATYCQHTDECDATITVIKEVGACETNAQR